MNLVNLVNLVRIAKMSTIKTEKNLKSPKLLPVFTITLNWLYFNALSNTAVQEILKNWFEYEQVMTSERVAN